MLTRLWRAASGADATKGDLSEEEEDIIDDEIATSLSIAREDESTTNNRDNDNTATNFTDITDDFGYEDSYDNVSSKACKLIPAAIKWLESVL